MQIDELSPELYTPDLHFETIAVSVGWLGDSAPSAGEVDPELLEAIAHFCDFHSLNHYLGLHECGLCESHSGGGEWWFDWGGRRYVVPAMMKHYIDSHGYKPPIEFQDALRDFWRSERGRQCKEEICPASVVAAARDGRYDQLKRMIASRVDITLPDQYLKTPLAASMRSRDPRCVRLLLERIVHPTASLNKALFIAISATREGEEDRTLKIVQLLIESGAQPRHKNKAGNSPLLLARLKRLKKLAKVLARSGHRWRAASPAKQHLPSS